MKIFVLLLAFVFGGELKVEQTAFPTPEACVEAGIARVKEIEADPRTNDLLVAVCVQSEGQPS